MAVQALLFLTTRSLQNAIKRAFTSWRRLITLVFAVVYYSYLMFRPMSGRAPAVFSHVPKEALSPQLVDVSLFGFFGAISLLLTITLLAPRGGFRQADVDVLFATPINPKLVLLQRVFRDYLLTLLSPLLLCLMGGSATMALIRNFLAGTGGNSALVERTVAYAWLLMALAWVCFANAIAAMVDRSDLNADRNKKYLNRVVLIAIVGLGTYFFIEFRHHPTIETAIAWAQSPPVRIVFFTATAATWMVRGAAYGDYPTLALGAGLLFACIGLGIYVLLSQVQYMYDQAAVKGFGSVEVRMMRRNNDFYGLMARQARDGKLKVGKFSRWIGSMRLAGVYALLWKEVLLQLRGARFLYAFFGPLQLFMAVGPVAMMPSNLPIRGQMLLYLQIAGVMMVGINTAISGFIELLKRVDFQKPLPFRPAATVFWEVASKCIPAMLFGILGAVIDAIISPQLFWFAIASIPVVIGAALVISATVFLVTIGFPDAGDASQRAFRAILMLIGMVVLGSPGVIVLVLLMSVLKLHPLLAAIPCAVIDTAICLAICYFSGQLYESYNPSE